ncbi:MAG: tetratricopeptide repeat protein [Vicingaceae bacterium]
MKVNSKIIITAVGLILSMSVVAQKAKVVSAYNYNKSFERDRDCSELKKGIEAIEPATKDEKTNTWAKTWYYGGNLYFNAALTQDEECAAQFENALDKTYEYYVNSMKYNIQDEESNQLDLNKESDMLKLVGYISNRNTEFEDPSYFRDIIGNKFPYIANAFINAGVEAYQAGNYEKAFEYSGKSIQTNMFLGRVDSLGMYNSALAAQQMGKEEDALAFYNALTRIKYGGPNIYFYIADIYAKREDTAKKIETIRKGLEVYPDNADLIREELSYLLITGQTDEALANFDKAIANDPQNPSLYYNRGLIYDELGDMENAAKDYNKALEVDSTFFDAAYNLGAMYFNKGAEYNNEATGYGLDEQAKYEAATKNANDMFAKALPALENAHKLDPSDQSTMSSLVQIYSILGEEEKYKAMKVKLSGK